MKKFFSALFAITLLPLLAGTAKALPVNLYENFYGEAQDNLFVDLWEGDSVTLTFDLTDVNTGDPLPTTDETSYDPLNQTILSGVLDFTFSSYDLPKETVQIKAGYYDGNRLIEEKTYDLGWHTYPYWKRSYASLQIDLEAEGLLSYLQDGKFDTIILSPEPDHWWQDNDIRLDQGSLTATATAPVPEPSTIILMGMGLIGMAGCARKRFSKKV